MWTLSPVYQASVNRRKNHGILNDFQLHKPTRPERSREIRWRLHAPNATNNLVADTHTGHPP
jgi:hypothetical protein